MNDALRRTGRTTRLIEEAVHQASCGFAVYVLVTSRDMVKPLQQKVDETWGRLWPGRGAHSIKVEGPDHRTGFDWDQMRVPGAHPNCVFLLDHYLVEMRIESLQKKIQELAKEVGRLYPFTI